jgi:hypothetical protein
MEFMRAKKKNQERKWTQIIKKKITKTKDQDRRS